MSEHATPCIIIHHSEISLKKGNRGFFEARLRDNINHALNGLPGCHVKMDYGRFLLFFNHMDQTQEILDRLQHVVGIAYLRPAYPGSRDPDTLKDQVFDIVKSMSFNTFRVDTRRADKQFPHTSVEINRIVGSRIHMQLGKPVDLSDQADLTISIEIFNKKVFFSVNSIRGIRGLPVGSTGKVVSMLSSGIDSPVSSFMMMTRGCQNIFVHFHSYPYTEKSSIYNAQALVRHLTRYQYRSKLYLVPLASIQRAIISGAPEKFRVILYRRMMYRLAQKVAEKEGARALVTGDSLGQVASQTLENIAAIDDAITMPVLRPLSGLDKDSIIKKARDLGTFTTSIEPHDDCCSYLVPQRPETKAKMDQVHKAESGVPDWQAQIKDALKKTELEKYTWSV
ncbi:MAG: tRNA uracil 4-sulfurtransferase ThiI [candidate division KSB1 bacterium]|nr:tRNA uracil 4-sulfurtransferase ThiI [candidate division KSB1 bacterium]